jgi:predicted dehydrogenase
MNHDVCLIGAGPMACEYAKVLKALKKEVLVVGRGDGTASSFESKTGMPVVRGGAGEFLAGKPELPPHVIVCVSVDCLSEVARELLIYGAKNVLIEKPGGLGKGETRALSELTAARNVHTYIAYNRRHYAAVSTAKSIIEEDGGVTSLFFEFTELSHVVGSLKKSPAVKERWFLANSSHVVDLAFYLGGAPDEMFCHTSGALSWHPSASIFSGAGSTVTGALFSYAANWEAPGRWGLELCTRKHRIILRPLETLKVQSLGSMAAEDIDIADERDREFKPGLHRQVAAFLSSKPERLCKISHQHEMMTHYCRMANYGDN